MLAVLPGGAGRQAGGQAQGVAVTTEPTEREARKLLRQAATWLSAKDPELACRCAEQAAAICRLLALRATQRWLNGAPPARRRRQR